MIKDIFERLRKGEPVRFTDPDYNLIPKACNETKKLSVKMNNSSDANEIRKLLKEITGSIIDKGTSVFTPLYINYGKNTRLGKNVFINHACSFLDLGGITIEDNVLIGPKVNLLSEGHPISPKDRQILSTGKIHIKNNAWIGAAATILAGVTVGKNSVVAAGSVVSKNVPDNTVVGGIPARVIRHLTE